MQRHPILRLSLLLAAMAGMSAAAPLSCVPQAASSPPLRANGLWERTGDLLLICFGGTPTPSGQRAPKVDITVSLTPAIDITSRRANPGLDASEALLLVDEPAPANQSACPAKPGHNDCAGNVYQGNAPNAATISFSNVTFDPPGDLAIRTLRITNLFVNASQIGVPSGGFVPVNAAVSSTGGVNLNILPFPAMIGLAQPVTAQGLVDAAGLPAAPPVLSAAAGNNAPLAASPRASSAPNGVTVRVRLAELIPSTLRVRNGVNWNNLEQEPDLVAQNVPGTLFASETGFYNPDFSGTANLKRAGLADRGTRVVIRFDHVPAGVRLFAPVRIGNATSAMALRMVEDRPGTKFRPEDATSPVDGGLAPLSKGQAIYEIVRTDSTALEAADIPVYVAFAAGGAMPGTAAVRVSLAPFTLGSAPAFDGFAHPAEPAFRIQ